MRKLFGLLALLALCGCAADGSLAGKSKPLDKEQTRLAICEGVQKVDIAFQTIVQSNPGLVPANVSNAERAFVNTVGFIAGQPDPALAGTVCAKQYSGDVDVAINTAIIAITNVSQLIKDWQRS